MGIETTFLGVSVTKNGSVGQWLKHISFFVKQQDCSPACLYSHLDQLPTNLKNEIVKLSGIKHSDVQEVFIKLAREKACTDIVKQGEWL